MEQFGTGAEVALAREGPNVRWQYQLPAILTMSADGTYERTTANEHDMVEFTEDLVTQIDIAENMDW